MTVGSSDGRTQLATQLGIVGAAFEPPIAPSIQTLQPPNCGVQLAGQQLCDERAICEQVWSGGVSCSCGGVGLRYKPGYPTDGQHCEQDPTLKASVQAATVSITVPKPGRSIPLQLIAAATGEMPFSIVYDVTVRWRTQQGQQLSDVNATTTHSSGPLSAYGQYIDWDRSSPAANWSADLDANARRFSETRHHGFSVRMDCEGPPGGAAAAAGVCAADGDVIETTMEFRSWSGTNVSAYATVRTTVESLL